MSQSQSANQMSKSSKQTEHSSFLAYKNYRYLKLSILMCIVSAVGYFSTDFEPTRSGGTWYGYTLGTCGALLIFWLALLGIRKRRFNPGNWSLKGWTSAHVYLGIGLIVVVTLHSGFQLGWNVHTLAYLLMMIVVISGIVGIYFYSVIPPKMGANRSSMTSKSMLSHLESLSLDLKEAGRPLPEHLVEHIQRSINDVQIGGSILRRLSGRNADCPTLSALKFLREEVSKCEDSLRRPILNAISVLERKNTLLIRTRKHIRYRSLLEIWLYIHVPMTVALIATLISHIFSVFYYN